jgi:osmotically-inducible protein OsmY
MTKEEKILVQADGNANSMCRDSAVKSEMSVRLLVVSGEILPSSRPNRVTLDMACPSRGQEETMKRLVTLWFAAAVMLSWVSSGSLLAQSNVQKGPQKSNVQPAPTKKTDADIEKCIVSDLEKLGIANLKVTVSKGHATLNGTIRGTKSTKTKARQDARSCGATKVTNDIQVLSIP